MQVAVRPYLNAGVALVGASVIAVAPVVAPPTYIEVPKVISAAVVLAASVNPIEAYGQLLSNTINNTGALANQAFSSGVAPLLQQFIVNQLTLFQGLNTAFNEVFSSSNPSGLPAILQTALSQLASGQIQAAAETISTGVIQVAFPFLPPLLQPLNNLVAVVNQIPNIALVAGIGLISPPLALLQSAGAAIQSVVIAISTGDIGGFINAVLSAPAVMLDGFINGYQPTQTGGLLTPGLGTFSILVNIRDMIVQAITPAPLAATTTAATTMVTLSTTSEATSAAKTAGTEATEAAATDATTAGTGEASAAAATPETASTEKATAGTTDVKADATKADETKAAEATTKPDATTAADTKADTNTGKSGADAKTDTAKTDTAKTDATKAGTETKTDTTKAGTDTRSGADSKAGTASKSSDSGNE
jgi:hypothetical protein